MIYITGDTHGDMSRIVRFCERMETSKVDIMIILGDVGLNYYGDSRDRRNKEKVANLPITLFCIHGNHERRPATIAEYKLHEWNGGEVWLEDAYPNILFAKDGEIYNIAGMKTIVIGGAYSVDKFYRLSKGNLYKHEILGIQKLMEILPDYEKLKDNYNKYLELDKKDYIFDVEIVLTSEIAVEIDAENNSILFYDGPKAKELRHRDIAVLKRYIKDDRLDEFYAEKIKRFVLAIFMSIAITYPEIDINSAISIVSFDGKSYRKERYFSCYPIQNDAAKKYGELIDSKISFDDCFNWIKKYTSLADESKKTPVVFSALSYVFNREMHEILIYSIIALENIYAPNDKGISYTLQKNMTTVFPCITKEMIKNLYKMRSKFVHGEISMGNYQLIEEIFDCTRDYEEPSKLAIALLIATIRKLIENDATSIKFRETISFEYCSE